MPSEEKMIEVAKEEEVKQPAEGNRCYSVQDLASILGVGKKSIYSLLKKNEFRSIQLASGIYRIPKKSFDEWLNRAT